MTQCVNIQRKKRDVCIGDMDNLIDIDTRNIDSAIDDDLEFDDSFTATHVNVAALIETVKGITVFDSANIERVVTHWFYIRFIPGVDINQWILFDSRLFDTLNTENLDERKDFLLLQCSERGDEALAANRI